ncbi:MAG: hypothetical protein WCQ75_02025, partial [Bacilli bacterium]
MNLLFNIIPNILITPVIKKIMIAIFKLPCDILFPSRVEVTIEGILAIVDIIRNLYSFIPVKGEKYVSISFGVP